MAGQAYSLEFSNEARTAMIAVVVSLLVMVLFSNAATEAFN